MFVIVVLFLVVYLNILYVCEYFRELSVLISNYGFVFLRFFCFVCFFSGRRGGGFFWELGWGRLGLYWSGFFFMLFFDFDFWFSIDFIDVFMLVCCRFTRVIVVSFAVILLVILGMTLRSVFRWRRVRFVGTIVGLFVLCVVTRGRWR